MQLIGGRKYGAAKKIKDQIVYGCQHIDLWPFCISEQKVQAQGFVCIYQHICNCAYMATLIFRTWAWGSYEWNKIETQSAYKSKTNGWIKDFIVCTLNPSESESPLLRYELPV